MLLWSHNRLIGLNNFEDRLLDLIGLLGLRFDHCSERLAAFVVDAGIGFMDCDQIFKVVDSVIGERYHSVFADADANDP